MRRTLRSGPPQTQAHRWPIPGNGRRLRTLGNESINKSLRTLAQILDEAEDATWMSFSACWKPPRNWTGPGTQPEHSNEPRR